MTQKISPFVEGKFGWNLGENGWNTGMDENLIKFSFLFDRNIDAIINTLPAGASDGSAYFLTTDNRLYFRVLGNWLSSPTPLWFIVAMRTTGGFYQFNGTSLVSIENASEISERIASVELTVSSLGSAAYEDASFFASQASLDVASANSQNYTDVLRQELADSDGGIDLVANGRKVINASQHGCIAGADISVPLQAAADLADLLGCPLVMDIPNAILSMPVLLPQQFYGQGCVFTGDVIVRYRKHAQIGNFRCSNLFTQAVWHGHIHDIDVDDVWSVEGYDPTWGLFYSSFRDIRAGQIKLDVSAQAVNGNGFFNCLGTKQGVYGLLITDNGATSSSGVMEAHANTFYNCDFSHSLGARNEVAVRNQTNYLISCYMEHGAIPYGNWTVGAPGMIIDGSSPPIVTPFNHVIGMADVSPSTMGDSISASIQNLCIGGDWSVRDANGVPPGFSASFAASAVGTSGAPYGFTGMYGGLVTGAYQALNVKFRTATGKFSAIVWVYSGTGVLPDNIVISDGVTDSYRDAATAYNAGGGWYLYRISGTATIGADATIGLMVNGAGGGTKEIYLGSAWVTDSKAALFPSFSEPVSSETVTLGGMELKRGTAQQSYVSGASFIDVVVTYGSPFRGGGLSIVPSITLQPASGFEGKATHYEVLPGSINAGFTVRIYYTVDWAGTVCWTAMTC